MPNSNKDSVSKSTRGGTPEQHAEAGRQSHKNDGKSTKQGSGNKSSRSK